MDRIRLFRLFDVDMKEIGVGVYNPHKGKAVVCMPKKFDKYKVFFLMGSVLRHCHSFMWCCPDSKSWQGHGTMNELVT